VLDQSWLTRTTNSWCFACLRHGARIPNCLRLPLLRKKVCGTPVCRLASLDNPGPLSDSLVSIWALDPPGTRRHSSGGAGPNGEAKKPEVCLTIWARQVGGETCDFGDASADPLRAAGAVRLRRDPVAEQEHVREWTADFGLIFGFNIAEQHARIESALENLHAFIDELLAERRSAPRDDLLNALIAAEEAGELLTDAELRSMVVTLMSAGHGTVQHQLSNAMDAFMAYPQQWRFAPTLTGGRPDPHTARPGDHHPPTFAQVRFLRST